MRLGRAEGQTDPVLRRLSHSVLMENGDKLLFDGANRGGRILFVPGDKSDI